MTGYVPVSSERELQPMRLLVAAEREQRRKRDELVRRAQRHPETFARVRAACSDVSSRRIDLDVHAAQVVLLVERARGHHRNGRSLS